MTRPSESLGEARYALSHAQCLHESLSRLPRARALFQSAGAVVRPSAAEAVPRCLIVGSWGLEVPYLADRLGWSDITCITAPVSRPGELQQRTRRHPNADRAYDFNLLEHDIESGPLPFDDGAFSLVIYWRCIEHLRHDPEFSLYELNRVTAPGGRLSLVTDNAISLQSTHAVLRGDPVSMRLPSVAFEGRWRLYTPREIEDLAQGTGWRIDALTTIVSKVPIAGKWWIRWLFKKLVRDFRKRSGLPEPYWNLFVHAHATKVAGPTRGYPTWLYQDEKIRQLKIDMLELVSAAAC